MAEKDKDRPPVDYTSDAEAFNGGLPPIPPPGYPADAPATSHQRYPWDLTSWVADHLVHEEREQQEKRRAAGRRKTGQLAWHTRALLALFDALGLPAGTSAVDAFAALVTVVDDDDEDRYERALDALASREIGVEDMELIENYLPRTGAEPFLVLTRNGEKKGISQKIFRRALRLHP